mgnify:CR=1 FL=1
MSESDVRPKKIHLNQIAGEQGAALVKARAHAMGFLYTVNGPVEAGIDGFIETRDPTTSRVSGRLVAVQLNGTQRHLGRDPSDLIERRTDEDADRQHLSRQLRGDLPRDVEADESWAALVEIETNGIRASRGSGLGVFDSCDTANLDTKHALAWHGESGVDAVILARAGRASSRPQAALPGATMTNIGVLPPSATASCRGSPDRTNRRAG